MPTNSQATHGLYSINHGHAYLYSANQRPSSHLTSAARSQQAENYPGPVMRQAWPSPATGTAFPTRISRAPAEPCAAVNAHQVNVSCVLHRGHCVKHWHYRYLNKTLISPSWMGMQSVLGEHLDLPSWLGHCGAPGCTDFESS